MKKLICKILPDVAVIILSIAFFAWTTSMALNAEGWWKVLALAIEAIFVIIYAIVIKYDIDGIIFAVENYLEERRHRKRH